MTELKRAKTRDKTPNWAACKAALKARGSRTIWLDRDMQWYAPPSGKRGRQRLVDSTGIKFLGGGGMRLGRRTCKAWSGYHRRRLVQTQMHCLRRLGERLMARTFAPQGLELHVRVALMNRFTQLGRPATVAVGATA